MKKGGRWTRPRPPSGPRVSTLWTNWAGPLKKPYRQMVRVRINGRRAGSEELLQIASVFGVMSSRICTTRKRDAANL